MANSRSNIYPVKLQGALQGKLNNTLSNITSSDIDNLSDTEISVSRIRNYDIGWTHSDGFIIHIPWSNAFARQIAIDDQSNWLAVMFKANGQCLPRFIEESVFDFKKELEYH